MAYAWQSVEEAAVTLGVSTRTLHRRISKNEVETRLESGRREVLVCLPDAEPPLPDPVPEVNEPPTAGPISPPSMPPGFDPVPSLTPGDDYAPLAKQASPLSPSTAILLAQKDVALANEKVRRTELALAAFQHTSDLLEREAWRTRISARVAWAAVAALAIGVYIAVGWTAAQVTRHKTNNEHLNEELRTAAATVEQRDAEVGELRDKLSKSEQLAARAQGELEATKAALATPPRPANPPGLLDRLAKLWGE